MTVLTELNADNAYNAYNAYNAHDGTLRPAEELASDVELPDIIPDWVLSDPFLTCDLLERACSCCGRPQDLDSGDTVGQEVRWAIPGGSGQGAPERPDAALSPSPEVLAVVDAVVRLERRDPSVVAGAQALADAQALLDVEQRLRVLDLRLIGEVKARGLAEQAGFTSAGAWLRRHRPDGDHGDLALSSRLRHFALLSDAVQDRSCTLGAARKVAAALRHCGPYLDASGGLIDGQPGDQVLDAVIGHVATVLCRELRGLHDDDPRLRAILGRGQEVQELRRGGASQSTVLEVALTWCAQQVGTRALTGLVDELVMCVLPSELEEREQRGQSRRGVTLTLNPDGLGWHVCADLTLECGERLWVALRAMASGDPVNPEDTKAWEAARAAGAVEADDVFGPLGRHLAAQGQLLPRAKSARLHDAFALLLERFLDAGLGGLMGKAPVQINVTLSESTVRGRPGAPPAKVDSGRLIPRGVVRRWWEDSRVSVYVLSLGGKGLRVEHGQRTLAADERRALMIEGGGRCVGDGCCPAQPDPLRPLRPHHVLGFAEDQVTSLEESVLLCDRLHADLHTCKRTVQLRDGRWLNEKGWTIEPTVQDQPPF